MPILRLFHIYYNGFSQISTDLRTYRISPSPQFPSAAQNDSNPDQKFSIRPKMTYKTSFIMKSMTLSQMRMLRRSISAQKNRQRSAKFLFLVQSQKMQKKKIFCGAISIFLCTFEKSVFYKSDSEFCSGHFELS